MSRLKFRNDFDSDDDFDFDQINREASGRDSVGENVCEELKHFYKAAMCCAVQGGEKRKPGRKDKVFAHLQGQLADQAAARALALARRSRGEEKV